MFAMVEINKGQSVKISPTIFLYRNLYLIMFIFYPRVLALRECCFFLRIVELNPTVSDKIDHL
jgi:hypothetical protein